MATAMAVKSPLHTPCRQPLELGPHDPLADPRGSSAAKWRLQCGTDHRGSRQTTVTSVPPQAASDAHGRKTRKSSSELLLEKYLLYDTVHQVYTLVCRRKTPAGLHFPDIATKRRVYQMVFDVLYRKSILCSSSARVWCSTDSECSYMYQGAVFALNCRPCCY